MKGGRGKREVRWLPKGHIPCQNRARNRSQVSCVLVQCSIHYLLWDYVHRAGGVGERLFCVTFYPGNLADFPLENPLKWMLVRATLNLDLWLLISTLMGVGVAVADGSPVGTWEHMNKHALSGWISVLYLDASLRDLGILHRFHHSTIATAICIHYCVYLKPCMLNQIEISKYYCSPISCPLLHVFVWKMEPSNQTNMVAEIWFIFYSLSK